jgi:hypothetical protein
MPPGKKAYSTSTMGLGTWRIGEATGPREGYSRLVVSIAKQRALTGHSLFPQITMGNVNGRVGHWFAGLGLLDALKHVMCLLAALTPSYFAWGTKGSRAWVNDDRCGALP